MDGAASVRRVAPVAEGRQPPCACSAASLIETTCRIRHTGAQPLRSLLCASAGGAVCMRAGPLGESDQWTCDVSVPDPSERHHEPRAKTGGSRGVLTVVISLACALVAGTSGVIAASAGGMTAPVDELHVFDLPVSGPDPFRQFGPLANSKTIDMAALPNGDLVLLLKGGSLARIDQQTRGHELPLPADIEPGSRNRVVAAPDGALLFSDGGRVLRRELDGRIVTVAGGPRPRRASGDGGPAVGAGWTRRGSRCCPTAAC